MVRGSKERKDTIVGVYQNLLGSDCLIPYGGSNSHWKPQGDESTLRREKECLDKLSRASANEESYSKQKS